MPSPLRIAALMAVLALLVPSAALAQSGGDGGAGDSQYQDPFGSTSTQAKPSTPAQQQQPAQQQTTPQPTPDHTAPAPAATAPAPAATAPAPAASAPAAQQQTQPAQTLPRTGFDVLPVAVAGLLLLLGGLALWRRPHGQR